LFEAFAKNVVDTVQSNPKLWSTTAILITFDESGGEYDSGYIQPIDFFGDGPRTVLLAVSPFAKFDFVDHTYSDHVSILKFIEWNWKLKPLSKRSRDNLPNPKSTSAQPYIPTNSPAIGDLTKKCACFVAPVAGLHPLDRRPLSKGRARGGLLHVHETLLAQANSDRVTSPRPAPGIRRVN
jgi:hypothetical protein